MVEIMADRGSSRMVVGLQFVKNLGHTTRDLLWEDVTMRAAKKSKIVILGELIMEIRAPGPPTTMMITKQIYIYIYIYIYQYKYFIKILIRANMAFPKVCEFEVG